MKTSAEAAQPLGSMFSEQASAMENGKKFSLEAREDPCEMAAREWSVVSISVFHQSQRQAWMQRCWLLEWRQLGKQ